LAGHLKVGWTASRAQNSGGSKVCPIRSAEAIPNSRFVELALTLRQP